MKAAAVHIKVRVEAGGSGKAMQCQASEALLPMPVALPRCKALSRKLETVLLTARIGIHDPAAELLEPGFGPQLCQRCEIEAAHSRPRCRIFLRQQRCPARVSAPGDLAR